MGMGNFARNVCLGRACSGLVSLPTCVSNGCYAGGTNKLQLFLSLSTSPTLLLMLYTRSSCDIFAFLMAFQHCMESKACVC